MSISDSPARPAQENTVKAIVQDTYGSADVLELRDIDRPVAGDGEVLVRVRAAGVDRGVWHLMAGRPYLTRLMGFGLRRPKQPVPGFDLAGVVEAVGASVTRFAPGDEVFGIGTGTYAEYALAPEGKLAHKPASLSFEQAAVVPISGLTALQAVRDHARVQPGQSVLVVGASGGVGSWAVQIAAAHGARVTGVASTTKLDLVRSLGAEDVIDYTRQDAFDGTASATTSSSTSAATRRCRACAGPSRPTGTLVIVGGEEGGRWFGGIDRQLRASLLSLVVRQRLGFFISAERGDDIATLAACSRTARSPPPWTACSRSRTPPRPSVTSRTDTPAARPSCRSPDRPSTRHRPASTRRTRR